jgi:sugar-specific transcriptional regulator TrmB
MEIIREEEDDELNNTTTSTNNYDDDDKIIEFMKIIDLLANDIVRTFPEYTPIVNKTLLNMSKNEIYDYCLVIFRERKLDLELKNENIFDKTSNINTEFFPGISFKYLWNENITEKTREMIWYYLQTIYYTIISPDVNFESLILEFHKKLKENTDELKNELENTQTNENNEMPDINNLFSGKLGDIAKELIEEMSGDLTDEIKDSGKSINNAGDILSHLLKDPSKVMNMAKQISSKLESHLSNENINKDELIDETNKIVNNLSNYNIPGMSNFLNLLNPKNIPKNSSTTKTSNKMKNINFEQMANELMKDMCNQQRQPGQPEKTGQPGQPEQPEKPEQPEQPEQLEQKNKEKSNKKKGKSKK